MLPHRLDYIFDRCEHLGRRAIQQDSSYVGRLTSIGARSPGVLAIIADGMGGHAAGEVASGLVVERFRALFESWQVGETVPFERSIESSTTALKLRMQADPLSEGMGSTVVAAYLEESGLSWISVGDSSLLRLHRGRLERLNANHSYGAHLDQLVLDGRMSRLDAEQDQRRHALMSALNGAAPGLCDFQSEPFQLAADDWIILASDGLDTLSATEIEAIASANLAASPKQFAAALVDAVLMHNAPHQDNVSVIAIKVSADQANVGHVAVNRVEAAAPRDYKFGLGSVLSADPHRLASFSLAVLGAGLVLLLFALLASMLSLSRS